MQSSTWHWNDVKILKWRWTVKMTSTFIRHRCVEMTSKYWYEVKTSSNDAIITYCSNVMCWMSFFVRVKITSSKHHWYSPDVHFSLYSCAIWFGGLHMLKMFDKNRSDTVAMFTWKMFVKDTQAPTKSTKC